MKRKPLAFYYGLTLNGHIFMKMQKPFIQQNKKNITKPFKRQTRTHPSSINIDIIFTHTTLKSDVDCVEHCHTTTSTSFPLPSPFITQLTEGQHSDTTWSRINNTHIQTRHPSPTQYHTHTVAWISKHIKYKIKKIT